MYHVCVLVSMYKCTYIYISVCGGMDACIDICTDICMLACVYIYICMSVRVHGYMQRNIQKIS